MNVLVMMIVFCEVHLQHICFFFFSSRRRHTRFDCDWSSDVCSSDLRRGVCPGRPVRLRLAGEQRGGSRRGERDRPPDEDECGEHRRPAAAYWDHDPGPAVTHTTTVALAPAAVLEAARRFFAERVPSAAAFVEQEGPGFLVLRGQGGGGGGV